MSETFERAGWRGIGVPVSTVEYDDAFLALALDEAPDEVTVSVWRSNGPGHTRETAFWMKPEGARRLAERLVALADEADTAIEARPA